MAKGGGESCCKAGKSNCCISVAVEICTYLFHCMFCGGICSVGSGIGGSDIS